MNFHQALELLQQGCKLTHPGIPGEVQVLNLTNEVPDIYLLNENRPISLGWKALNSDGWELVPNQVS